MSALGGMATAGESIDAPVVIVRDLGRGSGSYREIAGLVHDGVNVHEMDLFGGDQDSETSISGWADELERLLDEIPTVAATCIGDHVGSLVVEHFAATRPDRVERLILINPLHALPATERSNYEDLARRIPVEGMAVFDLWQSQFQPQHPTGVSDAELQPEVLADAWTAVAAAHTSDLSALAAPSLICFNEASQVHKDAAAALTGKLANSTSVPFTTSDVSSAAISTFLTSTTNEVTP